MTSIRSGAHSCVEQQFERKSDWEPPRAKPALVLSSKSSCLHHSGLHTSILKTSKWGAAHLNSCAGLTTQQLPWWVIRFFFLMMSKRWYWGSKTSNVSKKWAERTRTRHFRAQHSTHLGLVHMHASWASWHSGPLGQKRRYTVIENVKRAVFGLCPHLKRCEFFGKRCDFFRKKCDFLSMIFLGNVWIIFRKKCEFLEKSLNFPGFFFRNEVEISHLLRDKQWAKTEHQFLIVSKSEKVEIRPNCYFEFQPLCFSRLRRCWPTCDDTTKST